MRKILLFFVVLLLTMAFIATPALAAPGNDGLRSGVKGADSFYLKATPDVSYDNPGQVWKALKEAGELPIGTFENPRQWAELVQGMTVGEFLYLISHPPAP